MFVDKDFTEAMAQESEHAGIPYTMYAQMAKRRFNGEVEFHLWCECLGTEVVRVMREEFDDSIISQFYSECKFKIEEISKGKSKFEIRMRLYGFSR